MVAIASDLGLRDCMGVGKGGAGGAEAPPPPDLSANS